MNDDEVYDNNAVDPLIDDELWSPVLRALRDARRTVDLSQLLFDAGFTPRSRRLVDDIADAASRGARVRILVNENVAIPDSYDELRETFRGMGVEVRALTMSPNVLHAKLLVLDAEVAFFVDAPFQQHYVDTRAHSFEHGHRDHGKPFHAISLRMRGPVVARIGDLFDALWRATESQPPPPLPPRPRAQPSAGPQTVEMHWTAPSGLLSDTLSEWVLRSYERALANARRLVYIETQYFTSPRIAAALREALDRRPELEVVALLNAHMDVPTYDVWQDRRLDEVGLRDHPRVGLFVGWSARQGERGATLRQLYIHSKLAMVDDEWATIGSANLDSLSLHEAEEFAVPFPRNLEINAALHDGTDDSPATGAVGALRRRLWSEHLGDEGAWTATPPEGGWLALWRSRAAENLERFQAGDRPRGRIFPYGRLTKGRRESLFHPARRST